MQLTVSIFLIVCPLVFLAGFVDAIAGGGGMISLPAYLIAGVPVHSALGTNKLSSMVGTCVSTARYCRNGFVDWSLAIPSMIAAVVGSLVGANLALLVTGKVLQVVLLVVLPVLALYIFRNRSFESAKRFSFSRRQVLVVGTCLTFLIGIFDGFYGPGTGTFLLILYTSVLGMDVK
ncbi:MAG: sulfite exporter TauE/SafE family protein, partial [Lachnospiraceae bacterium]|nr:sulfite exporter TauE/SafE family protein [Lachnospiraceae bacterium]